MYFPIFEILASQKYSEKLEKEFDGCIPTMSRYIDTGKQWGDQRLREYDEILRFSGLQILLNKGNNIEIH